MKMELPCEIVQDLLPSYVDGLTSESSAESVEAHLKKCKACMERYENMKKEYQHPAGREKELTVKSSQEKTLFRNINRRLNRNVRRAVLCGITGIVLVSVLFFGMFNMAVKEVSVEDVKVSAHIYDMTQLKEVPPEEMIIENYPSEDMTVLISKGEKVKPDDIYNITLPENGEVSYQITDAVLKECPYVTTITYSSPYYLRAVDSEYKEVNGERVICITGFRTTILNNKAKEWNNSVMTMEFDKVDRIIYQDGEKEIILWEEQEE